MRPTTTAKSMSRLSQVLRWMIATLALMLVATAGWIRFRFGVVSLQQIVLNLPGTGGESLGNGSLVIEAAMVCLLVPAVIVCGGARLADGSAPAATDACGAGLPARSGGIPWELPCSRSPIALAVLFTTASPVCLKTRPRCWDIVLRAPLHGADPSDPSARLFDESGDDLPGVGTRSPTTRCSVRTCWPTSTAPPRAGLDTTDFSSSPAAVGQWPESSAPNAGSR